MILAVELAALPNSPSQQPVPPLYPLLPVVSPSAQSQRGASRASPPLASASPVTAEAVSEAHTHPSEPVTLAYVEALVTPTPGSTRPMGPFSGMFGGPQSLPRAEVSPSVVLVGTTRSPSAEAAESGRELGSLRPAEVSAPLPAASTRPVSLPSPDRVIPPHRVKGAEDCLKCRTNFGPFKRRHHVCFHRSALTCHLCSAGAAVRSFASDAPRSDVSHPSL